MEQVDIVALRSLYEAGARGTWSWEDSPPTLYAGRADQIGEFGGKPMFGHGLNLLGRLDPDSNGPAVLDLIVAAVNALPALLSRLEAATARVGVLEEALEPFAKLAGPINGEADRPTYIESIEGKDGTGELYLGTHFGTERYLTMWAEDFTAARAVLARDQFAENANCTALARSWESGR